MFIFHRNWKVKDQGASSSGVYLWIVPFPESSSVEWIFCLL